jgi:hypothetical protein
MFRINCALAAVVMAGASGCVRTMEVEPMGRDHPASADAASVAFEMAPNPFASASMPVSHDDSPGGNVVYTCPMHPEVMSNEPGTCPKCGMRLVVKKDEAEEHDHGGAP